MHQHWRQLTFLHWSYTPDAVQRLLPAGLEVDTFDGAAWVGLGVTTSRSGRGPVRAPICPRKAVWGAWGHSEHNEAYSLLEVRVV